tara:strand:+ start:292 stop:681 length:390 start_codon:yes stop_codon:yes gene_type:complete
MKKFQNREELLDEWKELVREKYPDLLTPKRTMSLFNESMTDIYENLLRTQRFGLEVLEAEEKLIEKLIGLEINGIQITKERALETVKFIRRKDEMVAQQIGDEPETELYEYQQFYYIKNLTELVEFLSK